MLCYISLNYWSHIYEYVVHNAININVNNTKVHLSELGIFYTCPPYAQILTFDSSAKQVLFVVLQYPRII